MMIIMRQVWVIIVCFSNISRVPSSIFPSRVLPHLPKKTITSLTLLSSFLGDPIIAQLTVEVAFFLLSALLVFEASPLLASLLCLALPLDELFLVLLIIGPALLIAPVAAAVVVVASAVIEGFPLVVSLFSHLKFKNK